MFHQSEGGPNGLCDLPGRDGCRGLLVHAGLLSCCRRRGGVGGMDRFVGGMDRFVGGMDRFGGGCVCRPGCWCRRVVPGPFWQQ